MLLGTSHHRGPWKNNGSVQQALYGASLTLPNRTSLALTFLELSSPDPGSTLHESLTRHSLPDNLFTKYHKIMQLINADHFRRGQCQESRPFRQGLEEASKF